MVGCGGGKQEEWESEVEEDTTPKTEPKAEVKKPLTKEESAKVIEVAIREAAKKPTGELTKADLEKVTYLMLGFNQLTEVPKGLEKLDQLRQLSLFRNKLIIPPRESL